MGDLKEEIKALMARVRREGELPSSAAVVDETFAKLGYAVGKVTPAEVLNQFNRMLRHVWEESLHVLEAHEERSYAEGIPRELAKQYPGGMSEAEEVARENGFRAGVFHLLQRWYPVLRRCFLSVSQSRKQRGGKDFELQVQQLLNLAAVPYHAQERRNRTDLVLPDVETYQRNRNVAAVVSLKRTLRERWAEVAEELFKLRSPNVFLFTADEDVTAAHVRQICGEYNIHLVVWDELKARAFAREPLVLGYTEWATSRLAVLRQYW